MTHDEERDFFRGYLKKGYSLWGRLKFRLWLLRNNRKVRTIRDVSWDYSLLMKVFTILLILLLLRYVGGMVSDTWLWFFPRRVYVSGGWL